MRDTGRRLTLLALVVASAGLLFALTGAAKRVSAPRAGEEVAGARFRLDESTAHRAGAPVLPARVRAATFRFARGTTPDDRAAFLGAVADARPDARRLIDLVDGLV